MNHDIKKETGGKNESSWILPSCSCGWIGRKEYAYNDWQHTNVKEQIQEHMDVVKKQQEENDIVFRLLKRAEIRRQIATRKSVQEGKPDRIADLLEEAAKEITSLRVHGNF